MNRQEVFDAYSAYYDLLYLDKDYAGESSYVEALIKQYAPGSRRLLELGCGTGGHAEHFARHGYTVNGIDLSASMLVRADARRGNLASGIAERMTFTQGDVRTYRDGKRYDVVLSLFHVFSYQVANHDLEQVFATAANHLAPGGVLIFDYWYGPGVLRQMPETRSKEMENEHYHVARKAQPETFPNANRIDVCYTIEVRDKTSGKKDTIRERHGMRYLFVPELELLSGPLFTVRQHLAWQTYRSPGFSDWSAVSVLERRT